MTEKQTRAAMMARAAALHARGTCVTAWGSLDAECLQFLVETRNTETYDEDYRRHLLRCLPWLRLLVKASAEWLEAAETDEWLTRPEAATEPD